MMNQIIVGDGSRSVVLIFDGDGEFLREIEHEKFADIGPLCVDVDNNIYVSDAENGVLIFTNQGKYLRTVGNVGDGPDLIGEPGWPAVNSELNKLYVADDPNGEIDVYDLVSGDFLYSIGGIGKGPGKWEEDIEGVAIGPWNLVIAMDEGGGNVKIFQEDGTFVTQFGKNGLYDGEFASSESLAYDPVNKRIVVADEKNFRVQSFSLKDLGF